MVLYVFVVAYIGGGRQSLAPPSGSGMKMLLGPLRRRAVRRAGHSHCSARATLLDTRAPAFPGLRDAAVMGGCC
jgi:hypothetical protein